MIYVNKTYKIIYFNSNNYEFYINTSFESSNIIVKNDYFLGIIFV